MYLHIPTVSGWGLHDLLTLAVILVSVACAKVHAEASEGPGIEVFVTGDILHIEKTAGMTVYRIDAIARLQARLSRDLPDDPQAARDIVLTRFAQLDTGQSLRLENAARGLARAMHYGIDRYPAIVFDGQAVVYGITDIDVTLGIWHRWQKAGAKQR